jgi:hypothetical protein
MTSSGDNLTVGFFDSDNLTVGFFDTLNLTVGFFDILNLAVGFFGRRKNSEINIIDHMEILR